jgi:hypothetical protein
MSKIKIATQQLPYVIDAAWGGKPQDQWYKPLNIDIINRTNKDVKAPNISFNTDNIDYSGEIRV